MTGTDGLRQLIRGQLKKDCSKCSKMNKTVNVCICKREICNEKKAAAKQTYNIMSYEMQIINNKALHLNSTLKFTKTFSYTMHFQMRQHCPWGGEKWLLGWGWGILHITRICGSLTGHRTQYIYYIKISWGGKWLGRKN